jgi:hypothetical protein
MATGARADTLATLRALQHALRNDLQVPFAVLELLRDHPDVPPPLCELVAQAVTRARTAVTHLDELAEVTR